VVPRQKELGDAYVIDAFGTAPFAHSSMVSATQGQNAVCVSGILIVAKEWNAFSQVIRDDVQRPLSAIVGGAKMSDKILVIENLIHVLSDAKSLSVCGDMAYTFMKEAMLWYGGWKVTIRYKRS
jgi:phosphoglycerate kinase